MLIKFDKTINLLNLTPYLWDCFKEVRESLYYMFNYTDSSPISFEETTPENIIKAQNFLLEAREALKLADENIIDMINLLEMVKNILEKKDGTSEEEAS